MWNAQIKSPKFKASSAFIGLEKESFFFFFQFFAATGGRRKERERGEPPFLKLERKIQFFLHCPDFIKGPIPLCLWADRSEIWRKGLWLIDLHSEWWRLDLEIRTVVFQSKNRASILMRFLSGQFWSWTSIELNLWFDWADFWRKRSELIDLHSNGWDWI